MKRIFGVVSICMGLFVFSCGATPKKCDASTCSTGCCDATGQCQFGNQTSACGTGASACNACNLNSQCLQGFCVASGTGGSGAGGGNTGGGSSGTGGGMASPEVKAFCIDVYTEYCRLVTACSIDGMTSVCANVAAYCATYGAPTSSKVVFDQTKATQCVAEFRAITCLSVTDTLACSSGPSGAFVGTVVQNAACESSSECLPELYCGNLTCPRVCIPRLGAGQLATDYDQCQPPLYRYNGVCLAPIALGASCAPLSGSTQEQSCASSVCNPTSKLCVARPTARTPIGQPCPALGDYCELGAKCIGNTCQRPKPDGASCSTNSDCASRTCFMPDAGATGTCSTSVMTGLLPSGSLCARNSGASCATGLYCTSATFSGTGVCATSLSENMACNYDGDFQQCATGLYCTGTFSAKVGVCAAPKPAGSACTYNASSQQCATGLYCTATFSMTTGVCASPKAVGAACTYAGPSNECQTPLFCSASSAMPMGVCTAPQPAGSVCRYGGAFNQCAEKLYCTALTSTTQTGVCAAKKNGGAVCTDYKECVDNCTMGKCVGCIK
jgi:hypothetical protein